MKTQNVTVVESTVTGVVKNDYTGQILGVECTTKADHDYVSERVHCSLS
jgi:squalene monooxygenase